MSEDPIPAGQGGHGQASLDQVFGDDVSLLIMMIVNEGLRVGVRLLKAVWPVTWKPFSKLTMLDSPHSKPQSCALITLYLQLPLRYLPTVPQAKERLVPWSRTPNWAKAHGEVDSGGCWRVASFPLSLD